MSKSDKFLKNVSFYHDGEDQILLKCDKMFTWHLSRMLKKIERRAREIVRVENSQYSKPGKRLMHSIKSDGVSKIGSRNIRGSVSAGGGRAPYAKFVHEGTQPHVITPKKPGGTLYFKWENRTGRVSTTVRVMARNKSKNSYYAGSSVFSDTRGDSYPGRNNLSTTGLGGAALRGDGRRGPARGYYKSRNGSNRGYIAGEDGIIREGNIQEGRGHRYQREGTITIRHMMYRDEQRWGRGKLNDKMVSVKSVNHPGYKGNPFLRKATSSVVKDYGWTVPF